MLNREKLVGARLRGGKLIAQCPACAEDGGDRAREHLFIAEDGRFGCAANPGDHAHRRRIFALVGDREGRPVEVRSRAESGGGELESGVLGRLGRVFHSLARTHEKHPSVHDIIGIPPKEFEKGVPSVPSANSEQPSEASAPPPDLVEMACRILNATIGPDDDLDPDMRDRLNMIEVILCQRDMRGRINYTASQIESCAIGLRRHAGTHPDIDAMLHRLNEAKKTALGWQELSRRWRG